MSEERVLPADVYDTLELSALAFGGIGGGEFAGPGPDGYPPICLFGHAYEQDGEEEEISQALGGVGLTAIDNDCAVAAINRRNGRMWNKRVTWKQYTRELNIVRGVL